MPPSWLRCYRLRSEPISLDGAWSQLSTLRLLLRAKNATGGISIQPKLSSTHLASISMKQLSLQRRLHRRDNNCTMLHCRLALDAQWLCYAECCFSTKTAIAPMQNGAKQHNCCTMAKTIDTTQKLTHKPNTNSFLSNKNSKRKHRKLTNTAQSGFPKASPLTFGSKFWQKLQFSISMFGSKSL